MKYKYEFLEIAKEKSLVIVKINCPPANSFTAELVGELDSMLNQLLVDKSVRALVLASGHKTIFLSGGDINLSISAIKSGDVQSQVDYVRSIQTVISKLEQLPMPVIACINGHALGGGFELALACDFRYMVEENATVGIPEIEIGYIPGVGGLQRLARKFGQHMALKMGFGLRLDAKKALEYRLVDGVFPNNLVFEETVALGKRMAELPTVAIAMMKKCIFEGFNKKMRPVQ